MYQPLLSMVTFIPAFAAFVLLMVARGEDLAAQLVCKRVAMFTTVATFIVSLLILSFPLISIDFIISPKEVEIPITVITTVANN